MPYFKKQFMKVASIFLSLFLVSIHSFSKDKLITEYRYSLSGIGFSQQKISFLSPVFYKGLSFVETRGNVKVSNKRINTFVSEFNVDINYNKFNRIIYSLGYDFKYDKYYLLTIKDYPKSFPNLYVGWGYWFDTEFYIKPDNTNNPLYYNLNNLFCLSLYCEKKYQKIKISDELNFPLVGLYSGSEYSNSLPYFFTEKDASFFQAFDIGCFWKNLQASNKLNIDYKMKTKKGLRTIRFQYEICSSLLHLNNNVKHNTFHVFKIGYLFNKVDYEHW